MRSDNIHISIEEFNRFFVYYYTKSDTEFKHLRFGQAFCNKYNLTNSTIFYEKNPQTAMDLIIENCVTGCESCSASNPKEYDLYCNGKCLEEDNKETSHVDE